MDRPLENKNVVFQLVLQLPVTRVQDVLSMTGSRRMRLSPALVWPQRGPALLRTGAPDPCVRIPLTTPVEGVYHRGFRLRLPRRTKPDSGANIPRCQAWYLCH